MEGESEYLAECFWPGVQQGELQALDERAHAGDLGLDVAERLLLSRRRVVNAGQRPEVAANHRQWRAQLVARVGGEPA